MELTGGSLEFSLEIQRERGLDHWAEAGRRRLAPQSPLLMHCGRTLPFIPSAGPVRFRANIVHNEGRELTSDENPFDPPPDFPASSREPDAIPIGIEFGHINLCKKVFDCLGLALSKMSANKKKHHGKPTA
ncbi:hypothetical protein [Bradyrhizobium sp. JYMT SZCCT0428]|uniref:hypothetical protein n=1 Tax=Bradyrhizobium sp. JYMT SZCCT0428 TaxID=2807673 RepID=UPI001BA7831A|nr:hypothetical protein [Bradyrhizobium sp. JYMT SZCCT0428]MBR1155045.1 hypothetical protein [Bradyrhizobium sp. JYMT SZCCT0428]